jgi:aryl-alcohol dehydrogenase-like predicted oxidoreductase
MVEAVWDGCVHCSDDASRKWLAKEHMPVFAWSSQARGFFLDDASGEEITRCWTNEANIARRERARALAAKLGVAPINIALAYVLNQKFPTFALVGPRLISETVSSCPALGISLTPKQCKWLWDGTGSMG